MHNTLIPPFPWAGNKRRWAATVWARFGKVSTYVEPFAGSLAVLLANPKPAALRREVVSDTDALLCNFWRAVRADPVEVAKYADAPVSHQDLTARHRWLVDWRSTNAGRVLLDADYCCPRVAGYWAWGINNWIGSGWCRANPGDQIPELRGGTLSRQRNGRGDVGRTLYALSVRLANVVTLNRGWESVVSNRIAFDRKSAGGRGPRAVFMDPPYDTARHTGRFYASDYTGESASTAAAAYAWAVANGDRARIAYCCHADTLIVPDGWTELTAPVYGARAQRKREAILFSPACLPGEEVA